MIGRIKELFTKYREKIVYLIFGALTTAVSFGTYYTLRFFGVYYIASEIIAWAIAVAFAFVVNKLFVFEDRRRTPGVLFRQVWQFVSVRIGSGIIETALLWLLVDIISVNDMIAKLPVAVVTVVINYIASKIFIFKKKDAE